MPKSHGRASVRWWRIFLVLALLRVGAPQATALPDFDVSEVAPGHYVHVGSLGERTPDNLGDQANIGFIVGERCVAVVDPGGSLAVGEALRRAMRRVTSRPVCHVIITHFHPDHFFGAAAFREPGVSIVAHASYRKSAAVRARPFLNALKRDLGEQARGSEILMPDIAVAAGDDLVLDLGRRTLRLRAWPVAHTDNDLTVFDEATGTLWLGDLLFAQHTPVVDGSVLGFLRVLDTLAEMPVRRHVPGHGRSEEGWPDALSAQREYLTLVVRETRAALRARKTIEEAVDSVGLSEAGKWVAFDVFHRRNVTATYAELEWE